MANSPITKQLVMAKCIQVINKQLRNTRHPKLKNRLTERIEFFTSSGVIDKYKMLVYKNCITLIHDDYKNKPNLTLYDSGKLHIGLFDETLSFHDYEYIRIHGDGTADSGACIHGYTEGDCITEKFEKEKGKEVKYTYNNYNPYDAIFNNSKCVNNDDSLPFFRRLLHNQTIGQGDYFKALLIFIAVAFFFHKIGLNVLSVIAGLIFLYISYKRIADYGLSNKKSVITLIVCTFLSFLGYAIILFLPTRVISKKEYKAKTAELLKERGQAQNALKYRCSIYDKNIEWLLINAETVSIANAISNNSYQAPSTTGGPFDSNTSEDPYGDDTAHNTDRKDTQSNDDYNERERRARELESDIRHVKNQISAAESKRSAARNRADSERQQGETYLSYARSEEDESRRNDYIQSADRCFSNAASHQNDADSADSDISSLESELSGLESELNNL